MSQPFTFTRAVDRLGYSGYYGKALPLPKMNFRFNQSVEYYVQVEEVGDWIEGFTVWGSDGSRSQCDTLDEVDKVTGGEWAWLSLEEAIVHMSRLSNLQQEHTVKYCDGSSGFCVIGKVPVGGTPYYRPLLPI